MRKCLYFSFPALLLAIVLLICTALPPSKAFAAETSETKYTGVLEDLQKDDSFRAEDYPEKADDYSLDVIQVAESIDKELFVYVYQPAAYERVLDATSINLSTAINDSLHYVNYDLTLLDRSGVFAKYLVEGVTVKDDALRYYDISSIFRAWNGDIDEPGEDGNVIHEVSYAVGKLFSASTVGEEVSYECLTTETIEVTDKHVGLIRYNNGFILSRFEKCDSHYIAFSTDLPMDKLLEADVYFVSQYQMTRHYNNWALDDVFESGEKVDEYVSLKYTDVASNPADGLFSKEYEWNRIESVEDFIKNEDLTDETLASLEGKQWVLRFYETEWKQLYNDWYTEWQRTLVSEVSILRLKFETQGKVYNLGVVDNKQTGDLAPDNNNTNEYGLDKLYDIMKIILAVLALVLAVVVLAPFLPYVLKFILWLLMLPARFIVWFIGLFKKNE